MRLTIEMHDPEGIIKREIADPRMTQKSVALTYAFLIAQDEGKTADWVSINRSIRERWSPSSLDRIKRQAWKVVDRWTKGKKAEASL